MSCGPVWMLVLLTLKIVPLVQLATVLDLKDRLQNMTTDKEAHKRKSGRLTEVLHGCGPAPVSSKHE